MKLQSFLLGLALSTSAFAAEKVSFLAQLSIQTCRIMDEIGSIQCSGRTDKPTLRVVTLMGEPKDSILRGTLVLDEQMGDRQFKAEIDLFQMAFDPVPYTALINVTSNSLQAKGTETYADLGIVRFKSPDQLNGLYLSAANIPMEDGQGFYWPEVILLPVGFED